MTEIEYQEFVRHCPYDAMGDYSMFQSWFMKLYKTFGSLIAGK